MANTLLHDDLVKEVEPIEGAEASVVALLLRVANRVETAIPGNNGGLLKEYAKSLRDGSGEVTSAVLANKDAQDKEEGNYHNG